MVGEALVADCAFDNKQLSYVDAFFQRAACGRTAHATVNQKCVIVRKAVDVDGVFALQRGADLDCSFIQQ